MSKASSKPISKERTNRSPGLKRDLTFHSYEISPATAPTAVLLLKSAEGEILCQTLRAITKFCGQDFDNRQLVYDLGALEHILRHIEHNEMTVKRFAMKALAQLSQLPLVPEAVLADAANLAVVASMVAKVEDVVVLEFATLTLSELTREPLGCVQLMQTSILGVLFSRMKGSPDPDVQNNCLKIINQLISDPVCSTQVTTSPYFAWPPILHLTHSPYLGIQHLALDTLLQLVTRYNDEGIQTSFRASPAVQELIDIIESYEQRDVHGEALGVVRASVATAAGAEHALRCGALLRLLAYLELALPHLKPPCLAVLTHMARTPQGRQVLHQTGTDVVFCEQLAAPGRLPELAADAAQGIALMTRLLPAAIAMGETNVLETLCANVADETEPWFDSRLNSLLALAEMSGALTKAAYKLIEPRPFATLRQLNKKYQETPVEAQRLVLQCFLNLQEYHETLAAMMNKEFMMELLDVFKRFNVPLKILLCEVLAGMMMEPEAKQLFSSCSAEQLLRPELDVDHVGYKTALCHLLASSVTPRGAEIYLANGTLHYMVENRANRFICPSWEVALEAIFKQHPSAKFAYTGRLDINDNIRDKFYVTKKLEGRFPTLKALLKEDYLYPYPVYLFSFQAPNKQSDGNEDTLPQQNLQERVFDDPHLRSYLQKLDSWFLNIRRDKEVIGSSALQRAQILAGFVCEQMCGLEQDQSCDLVSVDLHISHLMKWLESRVVGMGWVRVGGMLERALLYKALADRVALPCALCRDTPARAWVEVALPEPDSARRNSISGQAVMYPRGLLRANYVVDLQDFPGRLMPVGGSEARAYCGVSPQRHEYRIDPLQPAPRVPKKTLCTPFECSPRVCSDCA